MDKLVEALSGMADDFPCLPDSCEEQAREEQARERVQVEEQERVTA